MFSRISASAAGMVLLVGCQSPIGTQPVSAELGSGGGPDRHREGHDRALRSGERGFRVVRELE